MKIAIIGAGAMGSLFGGQIGQVTDVCLYDVNKEHIEAIQRNGLLMTQGEKKKYVKVRATTNPEEIGLADVAMIFTKYLYTGSAMQDAMPCIGPDTLVLTLQNGIGNVEIIKEFVPENQIAYGLTAQTSDIKGPGHLEMTTRQSVGTYFWPLNGVVTEKMKELERIMNQAGLETEITPDVDLKIWRKLMINTSQNTLCALLRVRVGQLMATPSSYEIVKQIVFEVSDVARAKGINISREEGLKYVESVTESVKEHVPSMAIDVMNKRKTEIACLNEAVVAEGKRLGVATPMLEMVARMIRTLEANYDNLVY